MLTDMQLRALKPGEKIYKVADQQGLYVAVMPSGGMSFRYDYRVNGRRETLVIGRYDPQVPSRKLREVDQLSFGMSVSLAEARLLLARARKEIQQGNSPSRSKVEKRVRANDAFTFGNWAEKYFAEAALADSTRSMRKSVYERNLASEFGKLKLEEITPARLMARCEKIKARGAAAQAVHAREIVLQVFRFVQARGIKVENPAASIRPSAIATFKARDRALNPEEIHIFFNALEQTATMSTLRLAVKFMLLTLVRKSEFIDATCSGDITYVWAQGRWHYLAVVLDLFMRRVVGWAFSTRPDADLVVQALEMAYEQRGRPQGLLFHSDRRPVCEPEIPSTPVALSDTAEHEPSWKLLGQFPDGEAVPQLQDGMAAVSGLHVGAGSTPGYQPLPDAPVQLDTATSVQ